METESNDVHKACSDNDKAMCLLLTAKKQHLTLMATKPHVYFRWKQSHVFT